MKFFLFESLLLLMIIVGCSNDSTENDPNDPGIEVTKKYFGENIWQWNFPDSFPYPLIFDFELNRVLQYKKTWEEVHDWELNIIDVREDTIFTESCVDSKKYFYSKYNESTIIFNGDIKKDFKKDNMIDYDKSNVIFDFCD